MIQNCPGKTALRVAIRRAAHQAIDDPPALRIGAAEAEPRIRLDARWLDLGPIESRPCGSWRWTTLDPVVEAGAP